MAFMTVTDSLSEGVRALYKTAGDLLPTRGLGILRTDDPEHVELTYVDAFGATAYRMDATEVPDAFRSLATDVLTVSARELETNASKVVESRLLHMGLSDELRDQFGIRQVVALPIPDTDHPSLLIVTLSEASGLTP